MLSTTHAIVIERHGGPEVLEWREIPLAAPGPKEVRLRHLAIAQNFSDINLREGGFYLGSGPRFPIVLGNEAVGVIEAVGPEVTGFSVGERVAYAGVGGMFFENTGAYARHRNVLADYLVKVPDGISNEQAAGLFCKGLTASVIVHRCFTPQPGDPVLVHAAASGVGGLLAQWYAHLGATVIGTVGSAAKAEVAKRHGCAHVILYRERDFVPAVRELYPDGVAAVLDGVGKDTFLPSLDCLRPFGVMVNYGNASGPVPPLNVMLLAQKGCFALHRPGFGWLTRTRADRESYCQELFDLVLQGVLHVEVGATYPLERAADAHRAAQGGAHAGAIVLIP